MQSRAIFIALLLLMPVTAHAAGELPYADFRHTGETMLMSRRFKELDAMAEGLRRTDARFTDGHSKLSVMYGQLSTFEGDRCGCVMSDSPFTLGQKQSAIEAWMNERPESLAARIAMVGFLIHEAFRARGGAFASEVTDVQWAGFYRALGEASSYAAKLDPSRDPYVYEELMTLAAKDSDPRPHLDALFAAATKAFPEHFEYYTDRAGDLMTIWYGEPGELAQFSQSLLQNPGGDDGEIAYAFIAEMYTEMRGGPYGEPALSWPEIRKAYAVRERHFGLTIDDWNALLACAMLAGDSEGAADIVRHIETHWNKTYRQHFQRYWEMVVDAKRFAAVTR